jgi:hypothetical protein
MITEVITFCFADYITNQFHEIAIKQLYNMKLVSYGGITLVRATLRDVSAKNPFRPYGLDIFFLAEPSLISTKSVLYTRNQLVSYTITITNLHGKMSLRRTCSCIRDETKHCTFIIHIPFCCYLKCIIVLLLINGIACHLFERSK